MGRSLKVKQEYIPTVKQALPRHGYYTQGMLAEALNLSQSTVSQFLGSKPIDRKNFEELCHALDLDVFTIADLDLDSELPDKEKDNETNKKNEEKPFYPFPGGLVSLQSTLYIDRSPYETQCYEEIQQPGALIRIKAPRQFGKTSLLVRILNHAEAQGHRILYISLQELEPTFLSDTRTFLGWFCSIIATELDCPDCLENYDRLAKMVGGVRACLMCFEKYILPTIAAPLTLGLDELDRVLDAPAVSRDFFALLRVMNEKSKLGGIWQNLRLVLVHAVHSVESFVPLDINQSPFNVGLPVELPEFTSDQITTLADRYQLSWTAADSDSLMQWISGIPFLVQLTFYYLHQHPEITLTQLLDTLRNDPYQDPLQRFQERLSQAPPLANAIRSIATLSDPEPFPLTTRYKLQSMGLVKLVNDRIQLRCELYRQYFHSLNS